MPANAVCQLAAMLNVPTPSRASALLQGTVLAALFLMRPARGNGADGRASWADTLADDRFALDRNQCRSALARECGVSVGNDVECDEAFAVCRSATMLNVTKPSRASALLQGPVLAALLFMRPAWKPARINSARSATPSGCAVPRSCWPCRCTARSGTCGR